MKSSKQILGFAVVAAILATFSLNAADPLLSPRAKDNQITKAPGTTKDHLDRSPNGSPKASETKNHTAQGVTQNKLNYTVQPVSPKYQP